MRSPVFSKALGECNAITSRGFDPSELIFASALEPEVGASISAFLDEFRAANRRVTAEIVRDIVMFQQYWDGYGRPRPQAASGCSGQCSGRSRRALLGRCRVCRSQICPS